MGGVLTPRERFGLLVIDELPDRCNIVPLITSHAAVINDSKLRDYYTDGEIMARAQIAAIEEYGHDAISIFSEVGIIAEALGSKFDYPNDDLPILRIPALSYQPIEELEISDPRSDGRLPVYLEAINYVYRAVGDRIPILAYIPAPFTTGMMLSEPEKFLAQTIREPNKVKKIMDKALDAAIKFSYEIIDAGGLPMIVDPLASSSVISPRIFKEFVLPYEQDLIKFLHRYDLDIILHICGETEPILDLLPETGADLISLDRVDLSTVVKTLSEKMRIVGNFDTSDLAMLKPERISQKVKDMVARGRKSTKGYIVATGCEVPIRTPQENIKAFIKSAKEVAWYWE